MPRKKRKDFFTMIEMLVVIGIIGILSTILLPALTHARENARRGTCLNNLKQIGLGMINYANEYGNFPRVNTAPDNFPDVLDLESGDALITYGIPIAGNGINLWKCPSSRFYPVGTDAGEIKLFGMDGTTGRANYALMTNWKGETAYDSVHSPGLSPTNVSKDDVGPICGDDVNDWTGNDNAGGAGAQINDAHCTTSGDAMGGNQVFSDGHGKWYNIAEITENGPAWSGPNNKYYWPEQ